MNKPYGQLVAQAEQAVSAVKDAELKRVAFEKILDDLLREAGSEPRQPVGGSTKTHNESPATKQTRTASPSQRKMAGKQGPQAYVEELIADGFFKEPKTISEVKAQLGNQGHHIPLTSLSGPLQSLCQKKRLRRQKASGEVEKKGFVYSNW